MKRYILIISFIIFSVQCFGEGISIDHAYLRKLSSLDNGTVHMFVKNETEEPIGIVKVILDDVVLPPPMLFGLNLDEKLLSEYPMLEELEEDMRVIWYQVIPNPIPPGEIADVMVKLAFPPNRLIKIGIETADGLQINHVIQPINNPLRLTYIGFSESLDKIYVYVENSDKDPLHVTKVFLDTEGTVPITHPSSLAVEEKVRGVESELSQKQTIPVIFKPWDAILPNEKKCIVITPVKSLTKGDHITVKVETKEGLIAESIVKVFSFFPICNESGDYGIEMKHIIDCPMHVHGSYRNAARKTLSRTATCDSEPTYMHICKAAQEQGSFLFSELTDIVKTNPTDPSSPNSSNEHASQRLAEAMKQGSSPHPWHAVISIVKDDRIKEFKNRLPTAGETRLLAYYALSRGTKGIFYRTSPEIEKNSIYQSEIKKINTEIQILKPFLNYSEPIPLAQTNNPKVEACALQSGYDAIILLLINHDTKSLPDIINSFSYTVKENFTVTVNIPEGSVIASVSEAISKDKVPPKYTQEGNKITIPIQRLDLTDAILIKTKPIQVTEGIALEVKMETVPDLRTKQSEVVESGLSPKDKEWISTNGNEPPNQLYTQATQLYEKITNLNWHYTNLPRYDKVIEIANKIISISPNTELALKSQKLIIDCYDKQAEYEKRNSAFEKYLKIAELVYDKERAEKELINTADRYFNNGVYLNAVTYYQMLIQKYPNSKNISYTYYKIAEFHNRMDSPDIAIREYKNALEVEHTSPELAKEIYIKLVGILNKEQRYLEALKILTTLEYKFSDNQMSSDIKFYKGYINYMQGNLVTAKEELQELVEKYPTTTAANQAKSFLEAIKRQKGKPRGY